MDAIKRVLVTGGTGSFGKEFIKTVLEKYGSKIERLVVFSRDEFKQMEMSQTFPISKYPMIRYFLGDVRDKERLYRAFRGIDTVIHAAALKQVPMAEYNPMEYIKTNVIGAENIISAAVECGVKNVVALSTDKAAAPINLYGATKLCADKLFVAANNIVGASKIKFSIVRYGNVMGSRGSVIPYFLSKRSEGVLNITDTRMTRFNILLPEAVNMVLYALEHFMGGEIFVPKIPSYRITDVAEAISPGCKHNIIGIRPGEKIDEELITVSDSLSTIDVGKYFVIVSQARSMDSYLQHYKGASRVPDGFYYTSGNNDQWLSVEDIRSLIKSELDPSFAVS